ncbi:MAG: transposase [Desulfovibrio sp.]|nr:transposase [Desulfovibrio sp.]
MPLVGTVQLKIPKLRHVTFGTTIIESYRRRYQSVS